MFILQLFDGRKRVIQVALLVAHKKSVFDGAVSKITIELTDYSFGEAIFGANQCAKARPEVIRIWVRKVVNGGLRILCQLIQFQVNHKDPRCRNRFFLIGEEIYEFRRWQFTGYTGTYGI